MRPTVEDIGATAYARWERRGYTHGHDRADWLAAERQLRFARNYRVIDADRFDAAPRPIGLAARRWCRFCAQGEPRTLFGDPVPIVPEAIGPGGPLASDQCQECASAFAEGIDDALARFVAKARRAAVAGGSPGAGIPADAFKGLVKIALALLPPDDLDGHDETIDWVGNPDHDFDLNAFRDLACVLHRLPWDAPSGWTALAMRTADDEAWPGRLLFLGAGPIVLQVAIPLGQADEDQDVPASSLPDLLPPSPFGLEYDPMSWARLPIQASAPSRRPAMTFA